jgi:hypothetical protein
VVDGLQRRRLPRLAGHHDAIDNVELDAKLLFERPSMGHSIASPMLSSIQLPVGRTVLLPIVNPIGLSVGGSILLPMVLPAIMSILNPMLDTMRSAIPDRVQGRVCRGEYIRNAMYDPHRRAKPSFAVEHDMGGAGHLASARVECKRRNGRMDFT